MKTSVESKIVLGFGMSVLALVGIGWVSFCTTTSLIAPANWVSHAHEVITTLESGLAILTAAETSQHGYQLDVNAYVVKPVDFQQFVDSVKQMGFLWALINESPPGVLRRSG